MFPILPISITFSSFFSYLKIAKRLVCVCVSFFLFDARLQRHPRPKKTRFVFSIIFGNAAASFFETLDLDNPVEVDKAGRGPPDGEAIFRGGKLKRVGSGVSSGFMAKNHFLGKPCISHHVRSWQGTILPVYEHYILWIVRDQFMLNIILQWTLLSWTQFVVHSSYYKAC